MNKILSMYLTLFSMIIAGCINMLFCKKEVFLSINKPIDQGLLLKDGRRLFGENKTWKGLFGYIFFSICTSVFFGYIYSIMDLNKYNFFYFNHLNTVIYNILVGFLVGLAYGIFELPNSFIKRRCSIGSGEKGNGFLKYIFVIIDQIDSIIGCILVISLFYKMTVSFFIFYVLLGGITHFILNLILYVLKLRKTFF